jgi:LPXTG-motif cell wall-anchored protein
MDTVTVIQVVAGILFVIGVVFLIQRRRKKLT